MEGKRTRGPPQGPLACCAWGRGIPVARVLDVGTRAKVLWELHLGGRDPGAKLAPWAGESLDRVRDDLELLRKREEGFRER
jgi:hypothetical protein